MNLTEGQGHNGQIVAFQPQDRDADQESYHGGENRAAALSPMGL